MSQGDLQFIKKIYLACRKDLIGNENFQSFLEVYFNTYRDSGIFAAKISYLADMASHHWGLMQASADSLRLDVRTVTDPNDQYRCLTQFFVSMPDMPFIVDTVKMSLVRHDVSLIATHNAVYQVSHNKRSLVCVCVDAIDKNKHTDILHDLRSCLFDVQLAVGDWNAMRDLMDQAVASWRHARSKGIVDAGAYATHIEFFHWLRMYFTFLGCRTYTLDKTGVLKYVAGSGLGVMTKHPKQTKRSLLMGLPSQLSESDVSLFYISKTKTDSTVHRPTITDMIGLRIIGPGGDIVGELRIVGLFTSDAYDSDPTKIPLLREKVTEVVKTVYLRSRYSSKMLQHIIKNYPREELFQASIPELRRAALETMALYDQPREFVIARRDPFDHYFSCLVFVPRDKFNTHVKNKIEAILIDFLGGFHATNQPFFDESILVRVHYIIQITEASKPKGTIQELNNRISDACVTWTDSWQDALYRSYDFQVAKRYSVYINYFSDAYQSIFTPLESVKSILKMIETVKTQKMQIIIDYDAASQTLSLSLYQFGSRRVILVDVLNVLSMVGLNGQYEQTCHICIDQDKLFISRYKCQLNTMFFCAPEKFSVLEDNLVAILSKEYESDILNQLLLTCEITLNDIEVLRCYVAYLTQLKFDISSQLLMRALVNHPNISLELLNYFRQKFDPKISQRKFELHQSQIFQQLDKVNSIDDDRSIRAILNVFMATLRTNFFLPDRECLAIKISGQDVPFIPSPASLYEIYMYDSSFEAIHIRAGRFARGGIRWSDRADFRTEVSLLEKAQTVKNALIVPTGAKGGFYLKVIGDDPKISAHHSYSAMIRTLLSLTDNSGDGFDSCDGVVAYDEPDTYLVVAADKGTARFSDVANDIAIKHHFWLGDAFASGGKHGYDHKEMGITAKGAWCTLEWYFFLMDKPLDKPFTVVGIGDMSGDVFGNGMLLSKHIQLVAAFNHKHIFIDPNPSTEDSYKERQRLFEMPFSQWSDYDPTILSEGAGIYSREQKVITISDQAARMLGSATHNFSPNRLISIILSAQVDVLWNGGIGTYVKSSKESAQDVDDVINRSCRINANSLRAQMVVEGGNLGLTQRARVEFAKQGGFINTDFIDNSAGVDCSDHEVNIKILMERIIARDDISEHKRNHLLESMKPIVENRVLSHNVDQNITLSMALHEAQIRKYTEKYDVFIRIMNELEKSVHLNRDEEFLPTKNELKMRALTGEGLTRPELSVLLSYLKIYIKARVETFDNLDNALYQSSLEAYFPDLLISKFQDDVLNHPLNKSIIALNVSHRFVSDTGLFFLMDVQKNFDCGVQKVIDAYMIVRNVLGLDQLYDVIKKHHSNFGEKLGIGLFASYQRHVCSAIKWVLKNNVDQITDKFFIFLDVNDIASIDVLPFFGKKVNEDVVKMSQLLESQMTKSDIAKLINMPYINYQLNIAKAAFLLSEDVSNVVPAYFMVSDHLRLHTLRKRFSKQKEGSKWDVMQRIVIEAEMDACMVSIVVAFMQYHATSNLALKKSLIQWSKDHYDVVQPWLDFMLDVSSSQQYDYSTFTLAISRLKLLVSGCSNNLD